MFAEPLLPTTILGATGVNSLLDKTLLGLAKGSGLREVVLGLGEDGEPASIKYQDGLNVVVVGSRSTEVLLVISSQLECPVVLPANYGAGHGCVKPITSYSGGLLSLLEGGEELSVCLALSLGLTRDEYLVLSGLADSIIESGPGSLYELYLMLEDLKPSSVNEYKDRVLDSVVAKASSLAVTRPAGDASIDNELVYSDYARADHLFLTWALLVSKRVKLLAVSSVDRLVEVSSANNFTRALAVYVLNSSMEQKQGLIVSMSRVVDDRLLRQGSFVITAEPPIYSLKVGGEETRFYGFVAELVDDCIESPGGTEKPPDLLVDVLKTVRDYANPTYSSVLGFLSSLHPRDKVSGALRYSIEKGYLERAHDGSLRLTPLGESVLKGEEQYE